MKKISFLFIISIIFSISVKSQNEQAGLNKIAGEIEKAFTSPALEKEDFGPIKIVLSNLEVFKAGNNITTQTIRKLQLSKRFKNDDSLFKWLIPGVNRIFLSGYFKSTSFYKGKYDTVFGKLNNSFCQCMNIASRSKDMLADNRFLECAARYVSDTAIINEYKQIFMQIPKENTQDFFSDLLAYSNLHCEEMFTKLIMLAKEEIPGYFNNSLLYYKGALLEYVAKYSLQTKRDSLATIFPAYAQHPKEIAALQKLYKQNNGKLLYTIQNVFENNQIERKSAMIADKDTAKIKLLGQFVFEVGIDKPGIYVRSIKYYPRESLQGIERIEKEMEEAKNKPH
jgi:hypothetical protein